MKNINNIKKLVDDIRAERQGFVIERERLMQRREDLQNLPLNKDDMKSFLSNYVDLQGGFYTERMRPLVLNGLLNTPWKVFSRNLQLGLFAPHHPDTDRVMASALSFLLADQVKAGFCRLVNELPGWPEEAGPPVAERKEEIAAIDERIIELDGKIAAIDEQVVELGIVL
ncbi:MAG: hypothetical protein AB1461_15300 [Thermodesulfobacteriota bacterium]